MDPITGNRRSSTITKDNPAVENRKSNQITGDQNSNSMESSPKECKQNNAWGYVVLGLLCGAGAASALYIGPIVILYYKVCMSSFQTHTNSMIFCHNIFQNDRSFLKAFIELSKYLTQKIEDIFHLHLD